MNILLDMNMPNDQAQPLALIVNPTAQALVTPL
jgi:hypothetical protein